VASKATWIGPGLELAEEAPELGWGVADPSRQHDLTR
jgi:hypothetical protein